MALPGLPIWHFVRAGYAVIAYDYPLSVATESADTSVLTLEAICSDAQTRITALPAGKPIACWGTSLGTALATRVAADNPQVSKLMLNLSYADITEHILHLPFMWTVPPRLRRRYIKRAGGSDGLHRRFDEYSPLYLTDRFAGRDVLLYLEQSDRIHRWEHTERLPQAFREHGARLTYYENQFLGHYFGCLYNHLRASRYLRFLEHGTAPAD